MKLLAAYSAASKPSVAGRLRPFSPDDGGFLVMRHGQIQGHGVRRYIGQADIPLDDIGQAQARSWQDLFGQVPVTPIYSSTRQRSLDTAALACPGHTINQDPRLDEIDLGSWDGLTVAQVKDRFPEDYDRRGRDMAGFRPPGGESFTDLAARALPFFTDLPPPPAAGCPLVVTHAGVIRVLLCHVQGIPLKDLFTIRPVYGQVFVLSFA